MSPTPNLTGFRDAQERLRVQMGVEATFRIQEPSVWPAGTPLDPQTGRPFDPTVQPESGADWTEVVKVVGLVFRPIKVNVEDPVGDDVKGGIRHGESLALSFSPEIYEDVQDASEVELQGTMYKIMSIIVDPGLDDRYIAFGEAK